MFVDFVKIFGPFPGSGPCDIERGRRIFKVDSVFCRGSFGMGVHLGAPWQGSLPFFHEFGRHHCLDAPVGLSCMTDPHPICFFTSNIFSKHTYPLSPTFGGTSPKFGIRVEFLSSNSTGVWTTRVILCLFPNSRCRNSRAEDRTTNILCYSSSTKREAITHTHTQ